MNAHILKQDDRQEIKMLLDECFHLNQANHRGEDSGESCLYPHEVKSQWPNICPTCEIDEKLDKVCKLLGYGGVLQ